MPEPIEVTTDNTQGEAVQTPVEQTTPEKPVGEIMETTPTSIEEPKTVGLDKFLDIKKDNKALRQQIEELQTKVNEGATQVEISEDLDALADEFGVDKVFMSKLEKFIEKKAEQKAEAKLEPYQRESNQKKIDTAFETHFKSAMEKMPEFAPIVNPDVIKILSLDPRNKDKTFSQLIEDTYGAAVPGKRTIETTSPGGGKEPAPLDVERARRDPSYFDEVMANPKLKAEYNAQMLTSRRD